MLSPSHKYFHSVSVAVGAVSRLVSDPPPLIFLHRICTIHKNDLTSIEKHGNPRFRGKITSLQIRLKCIFSYIIHFVPRVEIKLKGPTLLANHLAVTMLRLSITEVGVC